MIEFTGLTVFKFILRMIKLQMLVYDTKYVAETLSIVRGTCPNDRIM